MESRDQRTRHHHRITLGKKTKNHFDTSALTRRQLLASTAASALALSPALLQFIKAGKLRCIATGTSTRLPQLPDVPTVAEQGFKGFEMTQWYGLMAPSKMAKANLDKLEQARWKPVIARAQIKPEGV